MNIPYVNIHAHRAPVSGEVIPLSFGLHPWDIDFESYPMQLYFAMREIKEHLGGFMDTVLEYPLNEWLPMVGECGFDKLKSDTWDLQEEIFLSQATFAHHYHLPVIIHCVKSWTRLWAAYDKVKPVKPWIVHGFQSSEETLQELYKRGMYASFGTTIMDTHSKAAVALGSLPRNAIFFLETDVSETLISEVYDAASEIRNLLPETLKQQQWQWAQQLLQRQ